MLSSLSSDVATAAPVGMDMDTRPACEVRPIAALRDRELSVQSAMEV